MITQDGPSRSGTGTAGSSGNTGGNAGTGPGNGTCGAGTGPGNGAGGSTGPGRLAHLIRAVDLYLGALLLGGLRGMATVRRAAS